MKNWLRSSLLSSIFLIVSYTAKSQVSLVLDGSFEDTSAGWSSSILLYDQLKRWGPLTVNQRVAGSSPAGRATNGKGYINL
jgi:hypothetical protein